MSESAFAWIRNFFTQPKGKKKRGSTWLPALLFLVLGVLFLTLSTCQGKNEITTAYSEEAEALVAWRSLEEEKLAQLLSRFEGVERCYVSIHFSSGEESVREGGVTVSFSPAKVSSVVVLYEGTLTLKLKEKIVEVVTTLYGVGANRVSVNSI